MFMNFANPPQDIGLTMVKIPIERVKVVKSSKKNIDTKEKVNG